MWSDRLKELNKRTPNVYTCILKEQSMTTIFNFLKIRFLEPENWEEIASIFSPIVLHLVSEIVLDVVSNDEEDDLLVMVLFSNLINTFPSIQPLIMYFIAHRPIGTSPHIAEEQYLQSIFRLLSVLVYSFEIQFN